MKKTFITIAVLTIVSLLTIWILRQDRKFVTQEVANEEKLLLPNLKVDQIREVVVTSKYNTLTFRKKGGDWEILEKDGYLADPIFMNHFLSLMTEVKAVQKSDTSPSQWTQVQVQDPTSEVKEGLGVRVDLRGADGYERAFIVGDMQNSQSEAALMFGAEFDGRNFVRMLDSDELCLVDQPLSALNTIPSTWMMNILANPHAYKSIAYTHEGKLQWRMSRNAKSEPFVLNSDLPKGRIPLPKLSLTADYTFASMIIQDVMPKSFDRSEVDLPKDKFFELVSLDGFAQRIYLGGNIKISKEEELSDLESTGVFRKKRSEFYRYVWIEWLNERKEPPKNEPPYSGRAYLVSCPKMVDFMINREELLVYERMSPAIKTSN